MRSRVANRWVLLAALTLAAIAMVTATCGSDGAPSISSTVVSGPIASTPVLGTAMNSETSLVSGVSALSETTSTTASLTVSTASPAPVRITVLYDNTATCPGTQAGWGFSCLIEGLEKTVLFDTGADGDILLSNMEILEIEPEEIDVVVLSHDHDDHTGGLAEIVARNPDVTVYYPSSFSKKSVASAR
jgi:beta-lactamase superfamily II metal-dependent hydrolase